MTQATFVLDKPLVLPNNRLMINTHPLHAEPRGPQVLMARGRDAEADGHPPRYACHRCGATSYRTLMARGLDGAMRPSGRHACTGCRLEFGHVSEWMGLSALTAD